MNTENSDHESKQLDTPPGGNELPADTGDERPGPEQAAAPPESSPGPRSGRSLAFVALLFSAAALAGAGWMWWQDQQAVGVEQTQMLSEISRLEAGDRRSSHGDVGVAPLVGVPRVAGPLAEGGEEGVVGFLPDHAAGGGRGDEGGVAH